MKYVTLAPTAHSASTLETEIMFSVASARAQEMDFLKIDLSDDNDDKARTVVIKLLRQLKKQGRIQLFIDAAELFGSSTEAQYLANKYPEALSLCGEDEKAFIIKI